MTNPSVCQFGVLAREYVDEDLWPGEEEITKGWFKTNTKPPYRADKDLLLALGESYLFILRRRQQHSRSCVCLSPQELTLECSTQQRLASEFQCPHVLSYDGYEQWAAIEYSAIMQVQLTFRTMTTPGQPGLATRTKDLVVVVKDGGKLWVEFEHNLARGAFLDALMASSAPHVTLDLDYADLAKPSPLSDTSESSTKVTETTEEQGTSRMVFEFQRAASRLAVILALEIDGEDLDVALYGETEHETPSSESLSSHFTSLNQPFLSFDFRREALRKAVGVKVQLALQLSSENDLDNPHCHFLLGTAMELSRVLDEPDLYALTWLVSGFINLQRDLKATSIGVTKLAQSQLEHAVKISREHSLRLQLALALACLGDFHCLRLQNNKTAKSLLVEAAKLMPNTALDVVGKMQLHNKIHHLSLSLSSGLENEAPDKNVIDLWKALLTALSTPSTSRNSLLRPVNKSSTERSRYCLIEVHVSTGGSSFARPLRLRVYYTEQATFEWLRQEISLRCNAVPMHDLGRDEAEATVADVVAFYDSAKKKKLVIPWSSRVVDVASMDWHILQAVVHRIARTETSLPSPKHTFLTQTASVVAVRCSKCLKQMQLKDVETHSETCS